MSRPAPPRLAKGEFDRLREQRLLPNLTKIPLFIAIMTGLALIAWHMDSRPAEWAAYIALGYMWMGMVTFMHEALHGTLFRSRAANWTFGVLCMVPIFATFVGFREDHVEHHRHNRSPRDPDAFTMGKRGVGDFVLFYAYAVAGGVLSFLNFAFIYPVKAFGPRLWAIHLAEVTLKVAVFWWLLAWASRHGMLGEALGLMLWPILVLSLLNSMRFIAEHYGTPWNAGQMAGTRTVVSNPVNAFFWNNINWHIGHHVYPSVPWYNLVKLHKLLEPQILASRSPVDRGYIAVYADALRRGPESAAQLAGVLAEREARRAALGNGPPA
jgi:fatty acid desaturase